MNKDDNWNKLIHTSKQFNIDLNTTQLNQFIQYWKLLYEYNQHTNLVSTADQEIVINKHFIDSLSIGLIKDLIGWKNQNYIIDIGIGGGFPGIPILIANPNWKLCAVDSIGKKTKFIEKVAQDLQIQDRIEIINSRAEDLAQDINKREKFDLVVSRAVSQLPILAEYCIPFVKKDGYFVSYKARKAQDEINSAQKALQILGGKYEQIVTYTLPEENVERNLILIQKTKNTPAQYPRKAGIPKKKPL